MTIDINYITQVCEIIGTVIAIDGIIKQVALKRGNTKLVSICDMIANDLIEVLEVINSVLALLKPKQAISGLNSPSGQSLQTNTTPKTGA